MSFYRGQASFMAGSDLPIGVNDNIDQVQEERKTPGGDLKTPEQGPSSATPAINNDRLSSMRTSSVRHPSTRASPPAFRNGRDETADSLWLPHETVTEDRCKANIAWAALLSGAVVWLVGVVASVRGRRANPPVRITEKVEPFGFPDVAICPTSGAGCDSGDPSLCLEGMQLIASDLAGFEEEAGDFTATLDSAVSIASAAAAAAAVAAPQPGLTAMLDPVAHSWCPVLPLSELTIDRDGIDSGEVQSLHASVYVLWSDEVAETPLSSTRQFINTFFLVDGDLGGAVLSRLPYDRVSINGTDPSTFVANDVTVGLTEHVPLGADEDAVERVHTQVATIGQQTLTIDGGPDEPFAGAIMFATFSINDFSFQSVEEYDPVDYWTLVGAGGGILAILYALFGLLFVSTRSEGPRRMWRFSRRRRRRRSRLDLRTIPAEDGAAAASAAAGKPPIRASI